METILEIKRKPLRDRRRSFAVTAMARDLVLTWLERSRQRQALAGLDARLLRDIGLTPGDVMRESRKPFWLD